MCTLQRTMKPWSVRRGTAGASACSSFRVLNPWGGLSCHGLRQGERVGNSCGDGFGPGTRLTGTGREEARSQIVCRSCPEPAGGESFFPFCSHIAPFSRSEFWSLHSYIGSPPDPHCATPAPHQPLAGSARPLNSDPFISNPPALLRICKAATSEFLFNHRLRHLSQRPHTWLRDLLGCAPIPPPCWAR